ncbi:MAG: hypothetical protein QSU88_07915, partial [Candidatus Methanoperedens sp.]|nr:hypothetical protein [Candidatus Methanoperedens sp.]
MVESQTITIRLDLETHRRIEDKRGTESKSEFYRKIILDYLDKPADNMNTKEQARELERVQSELDQEKRVSIMYSERIQDLQKS